jgi:hypothetical protein
MADSLNLVGFKSFGCLDWVQEGGGVEDEVEGFKFLLGFSRRFVKQVPQENLSHFFPLKSCHGCCAPLLLSFLDAHNPFSATLN